MKMYKEVLNNAEKVKLVQEAAKMQQNIAIAHDKFGTFCDEQYSNIDEYMKSKEFCQKQEILEQISKDSELRKKTGITSHESVRAASVHLERNSKLDMIEVKAKKEEKINYLKLALDNYAKAMVMNDKSDLKVYRWTSLWFANMEDADVNDLVQPMLDTIPEDKFISLLYQLCSRMKIDHHTSFPIILNNLIYRCKSLTQNFYYLKHKKYMNISLSFSGGKKHPYHALPIILALVRTKS